MADLFSMKASISIRLPSGERHVMAECFRHPQGLLFFAPFWHLRQPEETIVLVEGEIKGDGPWKVGAAVVPVLGCHGADPVLAAEFDDWRDYVMQATDDYPPRPMILALAARWWAKAARADPAGENSAAARRSRARGRSP